MGVFFSNKMFVTASEYEQISGVKKNTVQKWFERGQIQGFRSYHGRAPIPEESFDPETKQTGKLYKRYFLLNELDKKARRK